MTTCAPPSPSQPATPAAARITTTRFIRLGPAPNAPRKPAVPNSSRVSKRSASSTCAASSPASTRANNADSSSRVTGSGSWASHARARATVSVIDAPVSDLGNDVGQKTTDHGGRLTSGLEDFLVIEVGAGQPGGDVGDQGHPQHLSTRFTGCDRLQHGGHADQVGAQGAQHADLGGGLVLRPGHGRVHTFCQILFDRSGDLLLLG